MVDQSSLDNHTGDVTYIGETVKLYNILRRNTAEGLERPRHRHEDIIKIDFKGTCDNLCLCSWMKMYAQ
jgi:hypothetical protein